MKIRPILTSMRANWKFLAITLWIATLTVVLVLPPRMKPTLDPTAPPEEALTFGGASANVRGSGIAYSHNGQGSVGSGIIDRCTRSIENTPFAACVSSGTNKPIATFTPTAPGETDQVAVSAYFNAYGADAGGRMQCSRGFYGTNVNDVFQTAANPPVTLDHQTGVNDIGFALSDGGIFLQWDSGANSIGALAMNVSTPLAGCAQGNISALRAEPQSCYGATDGGGNAIAARAFGVEPSIAILDAGTQIGVWVTNGDMVGVSSVLIETGGGGVYTLANLNQPVDFQTGQPADNFVTGNVPIINDAGPDANATIVVNSPSNPAPCAGCLQIVAPPAPTPTLAALTCPLRQPASPTGATPTVPLTGTNLAVGCTATVCGTSATITCNGTTSATLTWPSNTGLVNTFCNIVVSVPGALASATLTNAVWVLPTDVVYDLYAGEFLTGSNWTDVVSGVVFTPTDVDGGAMSMPTFTSSWNGSCGAVFTGTNNVAGTIVTQAQPFSTFGIGGATSINSGGASVWYDSVPPNRVELATNTLTTFSVAAGGSGSSTSGAVSTGALTEVGWSGASSYTATNNGAQQAAASAGTNSQGPTLVIGSRFDGNNVAVQGFKGTIAELAFDNQLSTSGDRTGWHTLSQTQYGLP
jgi:hypothetical protein